MASHGENVLLLCFSRLVGFLDEQGVMRRDEFADSLDTYADAYGEEYGPGMREVASRLRTKGPISLRVVEGGKQNDGPDAA